MTGTRHAVVAPRPPRPLAVSVVSAVYATLAVAAFAAAAAMLVLADWASSPANIALGAGLLIAILILFALYALVLSVANLVGRRWAWSAGVLTSVVLCIGAGLSILPLLIFILQASWEGGGVWETEGLPLQAFGLTASLVTLLTLWRCIRAYHSQPVRDYFGGV